MSWRMRLLPQSSLCAARLAQVQRHRVPAWQASGYRRVLCHPETQRPPAWTARAAATESQPGPRWQLRMLYDGDCPLCMREVNMLRRRDAEQGRIDFVDIASPDYSPRDNAGITYEQAMGNIHAISRTGEVFTNVEVFKRLYEQVGLGWVYSFASVRPLRAVADRVYDVWAKYRLPLTRRPDMATILSEKKTCKPS